jgi:ABC-2 type transport system permease protein
MALVDAALPENVVVDVRQAADRAEIERLVGEEEASIGLVVPAGFDDEVEAGNRPTLTVVRSPEPSIGGDYILGALEPVLRAMAGQDLPANIELVQAAQIEPELLLDRIGLRTWSLVVAIVLMLTLIAILAIPIVLAEEFEKKTIDALVLAMPYGEVIAAKALLGLVYVAGSMALLLGISQLEIEDWPTFAAAVGLTAVALLGLGLLLAGVLKNANQLNTWSGIFMIPFIAPAAVLGTGAPDILSDLLSVLPTGAGTRLIFNAILGEEFFGGELYSVLVLLLWIVVAYGLLLWQLKRRQA